MKYKVKKIHNCHNYIGGLNSVQIDQYKLYFFDVIGMKYFIEGLRSYSRIHKSII